MQAFQALQWLPLNNGTALMVFPFVSSLLAQPESMKSLRKTLTRKQAKRLDSMRLERARIMFCGVGLGVISAFAINFVKKQSRMMRVMIIVTCAQALHNLYPPKTDLIKKLETREQFELLHQVHVDLAKRMGWGQLLLTSLMVAQVLVKQNASSG